MPARSAPVVMENWKDGLKNSSLDPDTRLFLEAVYEMPLELVVAFEADRDKLAAYFLETGMVKGKETAEAYATELLGRLVWMSLLAGAPQRTRDFASGTAPEQPEAAWLEGTMKY